MAPDPRRADRRRQGLVARTSSSPARRSKHAYQEYLRHHLDSIRYVCLCGSEELIKKRLAARTGHFMNPALLPSQFEILEPPTMRSGSM